MRKRSPIILGCLLYASAASLTVLASDPGGTVAVVYNNRIPESKNLAEYYAQHRQVPAAQIMGFDMPLTETMTRAEYRDKLQHPFLEALEKQKLLIFKSEALPASDTKPARTQYRITEAKIRYVVLCYGVPARILRDTNLVEKGEEQVRPEMRRNEAAVDSELALLPVSKNNYPLFGPLSNPLYAVTNASLMNPTNGVLIVARLDGPTAAIARSLVDKALEAERDGLWGRAYFDLRGLTNGNYKVGDDSIRGAAVTCRRYGFETVVDDKPETYSTSFPMSQIALYAGWYDGQVSGPFTRPQVEFMPGAFAYHLHSFSAHSIRTTTQYWVGPLLNKGVTATMGCVDEPYLEATPDMAAFFARWLRGFTYGEAAYASQSVLSWQTTVIGDPLYHPFGRPPQDEHNDLIRRKSPLVEWSFMRIVNLNQTMNMPMAALVQYLEKLPLTPRSAVLEEKLGDLLKGRGELAKATEAYQSALKLSPSPQQQIRLTLELSQMLEQAKREDTAYELLQQFVKNFPNYPDLVPVYRQMQTLARNLKRFEDALKYETEIDRLSSPAKP